MAFGLIQIHQQPLENKPLRRNTGASTSTRNRGRPPFLDTQPDQIGRTDELDDEKRSSEVASKAPRPSPTMANWIRMGRPAGRGWR